VRQTCYDLPSHFAPDQILINQKLIAFQKLLVKDKTIIA